MDGSLHARSVRARTVDAPIDPFQTAGGAITSAPLVLIDLTTAAGVTGRSYLFAYTTLCLEPLADLVRSLEPLLADQDPMPGSFADRASRAFRLVGARGLVAMAIAGVEMAWWDALARAVGLPLARLLGVAPRRIPAYWNVGLCDAGGARVAAEQALQHCCLAHKIHA